MATDVEITRSLNALKVTLNDQRLDRMDIERLGQIVTAALGGEPHLRVEPDGEHGARVAWLRDRDGDDVGRIELGEGPAWRTERCAPATAGGYSPPPQSE